MPKDKILTFKTYQINSLGTWLQKQELPGVQSRARTRFIKDFIADKSKEIEDERVKMLSKYAEKDENDKPKMRKAKDGKGDVFDLKPDQMDKFNDEYVKYMGEEYIIDVTKGKEADIRLIANIVLNTEEKFVDKRDDMAATMHNEWCEVLETL